MHTARLASLAPGPANAVTHAPGISTLAKRIAGVHPARDAPRFASTTFRRAWARRPEPRGPGGMPVLLWPDTFTDHFHPQTGVAAVRVLEDAGCAVSLPSKWVCCGRPLYDWGMLGHARRLLVRTLQIIGAQIDAGVPIVVLEPSCASVFREELTDLLPRDRRAERLAAQTYTLAEFLGQYRPDWTPPPVTGTLLTHGHCHDRSVLDFAAEQRLLERAGATVNVSAAGCCGMAGAFGFEAAHYDVAQAVGEQELLPAVRAAPRETTLIADGFSCREQIRQGTGRTPVHLADVLAAGLARPGGRT